MTLFPAQWGTTTARENYCPQESPGPIPVTLVAVHPGTSFWKEGRAPCWMPWSDSGHLPWHSWYVAVPLPRTGRPWLTAMVMKALGPGRWSSLTLQQDLRVLCSELGKEVPVVPSHRGWGSCVRVTQQRATKILEHRGDERGVPSLQQSLGGPYCPQCSLRNTSCTSFTPASSEDATLALGSSYCIRPYGDRRSITLSSEATL